MTQTLKQLAEKVKTEATKVEPSCQFGDLCIYLEDGQQLSLALEDKQVHEAGITRFSTLKYKFKMIKLYFEFEGSKDVSTGYISLGGKKSVPRKEFKVLMGKRFGNVLPAHYSLFSGQKLILNGSMISNEDCIIVKNLLCQGEIYVACTVEIKNYLLI